MKGLIQGDKIRCISGLVLSLMVITPLVFTSIYSKPSGESFKETEDLAIVTPCK